MAHIQKKLFIFLPIPILSIIELLGHLGSLFIIVIALLQNPLIVATEFIKDEKFSLAFVFISILLALIPLYILFRLVKEKISFRKFIAMAIFLLFMSLISIMINFLTFTISAPFSLWEIGKIENMPKAIAYRFSLYRGLYTEPWNTYQDTKAGLSYSYPTYGFQSRIVHDGFPPSPPRYLYNDPPRTILYIYGSKWGMAFWRNPTAENIKAMIQNEDMKTPVRINGETYDAYTSNLPVIDANNLVYVHILLNKDRSMAIGIFTPVDKYGEVVIYNKLFLKIIESIKKI